MGRLEIRLCGARNIGDIQKVGTPDPYVKVQLGDDKKSMIKFKTPVVDNDLDPTFNQLFKFQIADPDRQAVRFELWNDNIFKDDLMGTYSLALNGLTRGVVKDYWAILTGTKLKSAELHLRVLAVDFGLDPEPGATIVDSIEQDGFVAPPSKDPKKKKSDAAPTTTTTTAAPATAAATTPVQTPAQPQQQQQQQPQYAPPQQQPLQYAPPPQGYAPQSYPPQYTQQPQYAPPPQQYAPQYAPQYVPPPPQGYAPQYQQPPPQGYYPPPPQGYAPPPQGGYPLQGLPYQYSPQANPM